MDKNILDSKKAEYFQTGAGNFGFWYHLGNDYLEIGHPQAAIECYDKAIEFDPLIFDTYAHIGDAYIKLNNVPEAISHFQKSVDVQPQYGNGWYSLGRIYGLLSDKAQSLNCYEKSLHCFIPPIDDSFYTIGRVFLKENMLDKAHKSFLLGKKSNLAKIKKDYKGLNLLNMGHIYFLEGKIELARDEYNRSIKEFGSFNAFIQNAEIDLSDLIKIGLDEQEWHNLMNEIKNPKKTYIKAIFSKITRFIKNKFKNRELYPGAIY